MAYIVFARIAAVQKRKFRGSETLAVKKTRYCDVCHQTMTEDNFYVSNNVEKYPDGGRLNTCKKCLTMHVDNWEPSTFEWILEECDVPYLPEEWMKLMRTYAKDPSKVTGTTILGRYLSKMRLVKFKNHRYSDSKFLQELELKKKEQAMRVQGYSENDIVQAIEEDKAFKIENEIPKPKVVPIVTNDQNAVMSANDETEQEIVNSLTDEDKIYLKMKWGNAYSFFDCVQLEKLYKEMKDSYTIETAGHEDTLKLVCKTSLKANKLIDMDDIDGYQKLAKTYDTLMKSGAFTAAQNKNLKGDEIDSIGELVAICERQGYIERFYIEQPNDKVDLTIEDMKRYTRTLIEGESNLSELVELAIKKNEQEDSKQNLDDDSLLENQDNDYEDYNDFLESELNLDYDLDEDLY